MADVLGIDGTDSDGDASSKATNCARTTPRTPTASTKTWNRRFATALDDAGNPQDRQRRTHPADLGHRRWATGDSIRIRIRPDHPGSRAVLRSISVQRRRRHGDHPRSGREWRQSRIHGTGRPVRLLRHRWQRKPRLRSSGSILEDTGNGRTRDGWPDLFRQPRHIPRSHRNTVDRRLPNCHCTSRPSPGRSTKKTTRSTSRFRTSWPLSGWKRRAAASIGTKVRSSSTRPTSRLSPRQP